jgi:hypothetical protein
MGWAAKSNPRARSAKEGVLPPVNRPSHTRPGTPGLDRMVMALMLRRDFQVDNVGRPSSKKQRRLAARRQPSA